MHATIKWSAALAAAVVLAAAAAAWAQPPAGRGADLGDLKPQWKPGDQWTVETTSMPVQIRGDWTKVARAKPIQWQFTVQRYEKVVSSDCYRVEVRCLAPGARQPVTTLWVDSKAHALRQVETQIPVRGQMKSMSENYQFSSGQPAPVMGPMTALPLDMPLFVGGQTKSTGKFQYEAGIGPAGQKALGGIGFAYEVEQQVDPVAPAQVKSLLPANYAKSLEAKPVVEVKINRADRRVRQIWQPGLPWPVYAENGQTTARLVKVGGTDISSNN